MAVRTHSELWRRATEVIPGGVNSPIRAMRAVSLDEPVFMRRGSGAYIEDIDGKRYVDWVMSFGPLLFGHADPETVEAVREAVGDGTTYGASTISAASSTSRSVEAPNVVPSAAASRTASTVSGSA